MGNTSDQKKKPLTEHLNPKILHFCMNFKVSKNLAEHKGPACGTLVFRGTVVGKHWPNLTNPSKPVGCKLYEL